MKTPKLRTHREAVIVETPTRITLPSTSAAAYVGTIGRYCVLPLFIHVEFHAIHCFMSSKQHPLKRMDSGRSVSRYVNNQHSGERIVHGLE